MFAPAPHHSHYVASKGAVIGFVRSLSHEFGPDFITVNSVAPGLTASEAAVANVPREHFDLVASRQGIPRTGQVDDQVSAITFLLSKEASFITGQTLLVDGGESHI
jgi:NAD(P)-dependent dehydrogenase (short-subunit alcohol dehydrogenase family)